MKSIVYCGAVISLALFLFLSSPDSAFGATVYNVSINSAAVNGTKGKLVFDFITNNPHRPGNHVQILNFAAAGTLGLPETLGGLVSGNLILGLNPAPFTVIDSDFFFNELTVNVTSFGNSITFQLQLPELTPPAGAIPDQFALFLLDATGKPLFPTSDPLGANALFAVDITGAPGGALSVFSPTTFTPPATLNITIPSVNRPPVARCKNATIAADAKCCAGVSPANINDGSFDPDGDPITLSVSPTQVCGLGPHSVTLTAKDDKGLSASCTASVTVIDTTPPQVTASLSPVGQVNRREGRFQVGFSATDNCDPAPQVKAVMEIPEGTGGFTIIFEGDGDDEENKAEIKFDVRERRIELEGRSESEMRALLASMQRDGGASVGNGQVLRLHLENEDEFEFLFENGVLQRIKGPRLSLKVTAKDQSGNVGVAKATPTFRSR